MKTPSLQDLIMAAEDINEQLGVEPAIKTKKVKAEYLIAQLKKAAKLVTEDDDLSAKTLETLEALESAKEEKKPTTAKKGKKTPEPEPEEEEEEE